MALEAAYHQAKALGRVIASLRLGLTGADSSADSSAPRDADEQQQTKDLLEDPEFLADQVGMLEDVIGDSVSLRDAAPQGEVHQYIASDIQFLQKQTEMLQKALGVSAQQIGQPGSSENQLSDALVVTVVETMCDILGDNTSVLNKRHPPEDLLNIEKTEFVARLLKLLRRLLGSYIAQRQSSAEERTAAADRISAVRHLAEKNGTELTVLKAELDRQKAVEENLREELAASVAKRATLEATTQSHREEIRALEKARDKALQERATNGRADKEAKQQLGDQLYAALKRIAEQKQQFLEQYEELADLRGTAVERDGDSQQAEPSSSKPKSALSRKTVEPPERTPEVIPVQRARVLVLAGHGTRLPPRLAKQHAQLEQVPVTLPEGEDSLCEFSPDTLRNVLGGSQRPFFVRISAWSSSIADSFSIKHYMLVDIHQHPWGPTGPGDHGYVVGNTPTELKTDGNCIRTHVFAGMKKAFYYCGEYEVRNSGELAEEEAAYAMPKHKQPPTETVYMSLRCVSFNFKLYETLMAESDEYCKCSARIALIPALDLRPAKRRRISSTEDHPAGSRAADSDSGSSHQTSKRARTLQGSEDRSEVKDEDLSSSGADEDQDPVDPSVQSDADDMEQDD